MSNAILVIGDSGTGKSTAIKTLPPEQTFIINCIGKDMPFKGWKGKYINVSTDGKTGNYFASDNPARILKILDVINDTRKDIKYIVVDDFVYVMSQEFMRRADEKGYDKFTDIAKKAWMIFEKAKTLRPDISVAILSHLEEYMDISGIRRQKVKTVGKLTDNLVNLEGMCTVVLYTEVKKVGDKHEYGFSTKNSGNNTCKTPDGMFEVSFIPNDLKLVFDRIDEYNI